MGVKEALRSDFASDLLNALVEKFRSSVIDEVIQRMQYDTQNELKKLQETLLNAQALVNIPICQLSTTTAWEHWVEEVTQICYDTEDLFDDLTFGSRKGPLIDKLLSYFTRGSKIQGLQDRVQDAVNGLKLNIKAAQLQIHPVSHPCTLLPHPERVIGRDEDRENIINMLLETTGSAYSVVGMGGIGKTRLALSVLEDPKIIANFKHILWVTVSADFDPVKASESLLNKRLERELPRVKKRLESGFGFEVDSYDLFQELFKAESALIVLDDVWNVRYNDWITFCDKFMKSSPCKLLLTTRNPKVALDTQATPYYLDHMKDEDCGALIMSRAISRGTLVERQKIILNDIVGEMAKKCKGSPLVANIIGLHIASIASEEYWRVLLKMKLSDFSVFREQIFPCFKLNNPEFPLYLKRCLAYCSLFPPNCAFKKEKMVQLWSAEGLIVPRGIASQQEIGNEYFLELLARSIFEASDLGDQKNSTYKMHEFFHWFAEYLAYNVCICLEEGTSSHVTLSQEARHMSLILSNIETSLLKKIEKCESLRTLLVLSSSTVIENGHVPRSLFEKLWRLRTLDLSSTNVSELPESICRLKRLRYLDVSKTNIEKLPESTSELHGLEALILKGCCNLLALPKNTKNMTSLQHLVVDKNGLEAMPAAIGSLCCLQTLPIFIVGKKEGKRLTELKNLKSLSGSICISSLENVKDGAEAKETKLNEKDGITKLELEWSRYSRDGAIAMEVLDALRPYKTLEELQITNYGGSSFPDWFTHPSLLLVSIHLKNCRQQDVLPSLGKLPFLKTLHLEGMDNVKHVDYHFCGGLNGGFPSLESLKIQHSICLKKWYKSRTGGIPESFEFVEKA